jgi:hypothetical protein
MESTTSNNNEKNGLVACCPKELGDLFESLTGAVLFDSGESIVVLLKVFFTLS